MSEADGALAFSIFEQLLEREPADRADFLDRACAGRPSFRRRLERMIAADSRELPLLDHPLDAFAAVLEPDTTRWLGRQLGSYRIIRELGRGGMGLVYLAERDDVGMKVALKLLDTRLASPEAINRFEYERRVLAGLEHPNIARFLDAGVSPDGTPWLAMEYIEGSPITEHCESLKLGLQSRLCLFEEVAEAVAYAHRHLLVHRDLKPSNIIVSKTGQPKLVDFGIAKLLGDDANLTVESAPGPMTPAYASPEQLQGEPVTTASDVYQLGVLLYELVSGTRPLSPRGHVLGPFERAARITPLDLSRAVARARPDAPRQFRRGLTRDLDAIVGTALRDRPADRYASASGLVEDLRRSRVGLPILAGTPSLAYRAFRFARRHRVPVALTGLLLVVALIAGVALYIQSRLLDQERSRASQVSQVLERMILEAVPGRQGPDTTATRAVLRNVVAEARTGLRSGEATWAGLMLLAGNVYRDIGEVDTALTLWQEVVDALEPRRDREDGTLLITMGMLGATLTERGSVARGLPILERLDTMARGLAASRVAERANALYLVAYGHQVAGQRDRARRNAGEVLALRPLLPDSAEVMIDRALLVLSRVELDEGHYAGADTLSREAVAMRERRDGPGHERTLNALAVLGEALLGEDRIAEADTVSRRILAGRQRLYQPPHTDLAAALLLRSEVVRRQGRREEARALARDALGQYRAIYPPGHPMVRRAEAAAEAEN